MIRSIIIVIGLLFFVTSIASAEGICKEAEQQFKAAVEVYLKDGDSAFIERVLKDGPLEGDKRALSQVQMLGQIEQFFGPLKSSSVLSKKQLGSKACYLIGVLEYSNGPAFAVATYYQGEKGIGPSSMFFKTEPEAILPPELLVQSGLTN